MASSYRGDPFWMRARFNGVCKCGAPIFKNERIFYYPKGRVACGATCGCAKAAAADFAACVADEDFYNGF